MSKIEIKSNIVDRIYLLAVTLIQALQSVLGGFLWYIFIIPLTWVFRTKKTDVIEK